MTAGETEGRGTPWNSRSDSFAGTLPKPSLWVDSGSMILLRSPVTLWCQGTRQADSYHLSKEGVSKPWDTQTPLDSRDTVGFSIESMSAHTAGRFRCVYHSSGVWSEPSDPLHLVVTGKREEPAPSSMIPSSRRREGSLAIRGPTGVMGAPL